MCGIAGWISSQGKVDGAVLVQMGRRLAHRGPDGKGIWVNEDRTLGLAHRRLSIIDLSPLADQPMFARRGSLAIAFNGEIYNHRSLRKDLKQLGAHFETHHSDTETLLHGYRHWGLGGLLERVNGMFAFALFDQNTNEVVLARDRLGIKPLYYGRFQEQVLFASEIKALLVHPAVPAEVDWSRLPTHLTFRSLPAPATLFKGVSKLRAGEWIKVRVDSGRWNRRRYWDPLSRAPSGPVSGKDAAAELSTLLESSVRYRLESDVPVGVFLSAGMDSSYIAKTVARQGRLRTFTVSYPGHPEYEEGREASAWARTLGAEHHPVQVDSASFGSILPAVTFWQDEPAVAPVSASVYFLSRAAREVGVPVVLAGEGSDELFVGYRRWLYMRDLSRFSALLSRLPRKPLEWGARLVRRCYGPLAPHTEIARRVSTGELIFWGGALDFPLGFQQELLREAAPGLDVFDAAVSQFHREFVESSSFEGDITGWMSYVDLRFRLPELMLPRLDRMGMAVSVEGRVPFLDHRVVEFVMSLPPRLRAAKGRASKPLLKAALRDTLSPDILQRRKRGFRAPVSDWTGAPVTRVLKDSLRRFAADTGVFRSQPLEQVLAARTSRLYFSLVSFMLWYTIFIEDRFQGELWAAMDEHSPGGLARPWES